MTHYARVLVFGLLLVLTTAALAAVQTVTLSVKNMV
jgi:hypothetical protein